MGDYIPDAPVNEEARKRNGNLPGMGGIFNLVNMHVYHYAGNNPVKYTDPDGKWSFSLGVGVNAGAGTGGQASAGVSIGYSKEEGLSIGFFTSKSLGSVFGATAGVNVNVTVAPSAKSVTDASGMSVTIGGTGGEGLVLGGDLNINLDGSGESYSGNIGAGIGSPGEGHIMITSTEVHGDSVSNIARNIRDAAVKYVVKEFIEPILSQIP
jgi:hypothetical protein